MNSTMASQPIRTWRRFTAVAVLVALLAGALAGVSRTARAAAAEPESAGSYRCKSVNACKAGSMSCNFYCGPAGCSCSSYDPIIVK